MNLNFWQINSDMTVTLEGLKDSLGAYLNTATVSGQLKDGATPIGGSLSFTYVPASNGNYVAELPAATVASLIEDRQYSMLITATAGGDTITIEVRRLARYRRG